MDKVNVHSLMHPSIKPAELIVTDKSNPGVEVGFQIVEPSIVRMLELANIIENYTTVYITSSEPIGIPCGDSVIVPKKEIVELACSIFALQLDPSTGYQVEEIIVLIETMPHGMMKVIGAVKSMTEEFSALMTDPILAPTTAH